MRVKGFYPFGFLLTLHNLPRLCQNSTYRLKTAGLTSIPSYVFLSTNVLRLKQDLCTSYYKDVHTNKPVFSCHIDSAPFFL